MCPLQMKDTIAKFCDFIFQKSSDEDTIESTVTHVLAGILSIRKAAEKYDLIASTLQHRIEKSRLNSQRNNEELPRRQTYSPKYMTSRVLTKEQEGHLDDYIIKSSKMHYGLTLTQTRSLAYEYAKKFNCKYPASWDINKLAGIDWLTGFRKRNPNINLRKPENTILARSFSFNKSAVDEFYANYGILLARQNFTPDRILNFDETGITTVLNTPKVLTEKKQRQVGELVSAERGELVTFCGIITAIGNSVLPI
ncbi:hypothetical protein JTB14_038064 [Gonioctena quinquepunctata]|nr:hypothetical protein JTB14_038064 [Gonioctena quinquepunctata]